MTMLSLALQGLRGRRSAFAGAFGALFLAALLVTAAGVMLASAVRAQAPTERYAGAPIVVAGQQVFHRPHAGEAGGEALLPERARVPAALTGRLAALPGVRAALADVSVPTEVVAAHGPVPGPGGHDTLLHNWSSAALTPFRLQAGRAPSSAGEVVVDSGLARRGRLRVGERVRLAAIDQARPLTVVGVVAARPALQRQAAVFVGDSEAGRLAGHSERVDAVGLLLAPGVDPARVAAAARGMVGHEAAVLTDDRRGSAEFLDFGDVREGLMAITGTFGALALVIAMFVVAGTLGLAMQLRERELALLRAVAATPRQVRRMLRWEAVLLALGASLAAYLPGIALAGLLNDAFADRGLAPEGMPIAGGPIAGLVTVAATVATALASAWAGSRRAARMAPTRALQEAAVEPRLIGFGRLLSGLLALAGGLAAVAIAGSAADEDTATAAALAASLVLVAGVALLGPLVTRLAALIPGALLARISPVGGFLAVAAARTAPRRLASAMTPIVLTVAMASVLLFTGTTLDHATASQSRERQAAQLALHGGELGVPESALEHARRTPGVAAAVGIASTGVVALDGLGSAFAPMPAQMVDGEDAAKVLDLGVRSGALDRLRGRTVALGHALARARGIRLGDRIPLALGDGTKVRLRVVATYERTLGFGEVLLPRELAAPHATDPLPEAVLVRTAPGASAPRAARSLRRLAAAYPGLEVADRAALRSADDGVRHMRTWLNHVLAALIFAFASIAAVNTLSMIALARGRELALLRLVGATPRQVARMARWEAGLIVLFGIGLGAAISLATLVPFSAVLTGSATPYVPPLAFGGIVAVTAALGFLASQLPTRLALRAEPAEAIGLRE
jgi:putative ABC transport system permease protein